jgi:hypothetical protein
MIKYSLVCDSAHGFESWFPDSASYDTQVKRGLVECPTCQSRQVSKAMMAPAVSTSRSKEARRESMQAAAEAEAAPAPAAAAVPAPQPVALLDERQQAVRAMIRELHDKLTENSTDVGSSFPEEARRMHDGEAPQRSIHGQATFEEAKALVEEGIPVLPLPVLPDDRN